MAAGGGHGIGEMFAKAEWGAAMSLIHANEFIALGGMVLGSMVVMAPMTVLKGVISQLLGTPPLPLPPLPCPPAVVCWGP